MIYDVAIVGGGPAGLACAIELRLLGRTVVVCERALLRSEHGYAGIDKACGEGVMPTGLARLTALGVLSHLDEKRSAPIVGIRYINEDGTTAEAPLAAPGLGIRRVALSEALLRRAEEVGVVFHVGLVALDTATSEGYRLTCANDAALEAHFLIAADGLHSKLRKQVFGEADHDVDPPGHKQQRRYGIRQHYAIAPWTDHVEVHFSRGFEAYVTPVGKNEIGLAFLWDGSRSTSSTGALTLESILAEFPRLATRVAHAKVTSSTRGAGPLLRRVEDVVATDFALLGDAAGYVDAITGEGITLALHSAHALAQEVGSKRRGAMAGYAREHRSIFRRYAALANALLQLAERPRVRRWVVARLAQQPKLFAFVLAKAIV